MTAPAPLDLPALLDDLERAHAAATPGPWEVLPEEGVWEHAPSGNFGTFITSLDDLRPEHAALIVAAVNAVPTLIAELRKRDAAPSPTAEPLYPLSRRCCGAADATACHQYGLCQMQGVHPSSGDATARRLAWFTDDELRAELTRRAALSPESVPS